MDSDVTTTPVTGTFGEQTTTDFFSESLDTFGTSKNFFTQTGKMRTPSKEKSLSSFFKKFSEPKEFNRSDSSLSSRMRQSRLTVAEKMQMEALDYVDRKLRKNQRARSMGSLKRQRPMCIKECEVFGESVGFSLAERNSCKFESTGFDKLFVSKIIK